MRLGAYTPKYPYRTGVVGQGLNVRDGRVWASHLKMIPISEKQVNPGQIPTTGTQLLLYPFYLGSYLLEYSCVRLAGSCWFSLTSAVTFIPWQGEYRGAQGTIETRRHQTLPVPKPQGHRIAQKALPAAP